MEKIKDLKNAFWGKILDQTSSNYTQIEENNKIFGGIFSKFYLFF